MKATLMCAAALAVALTIPSFADAGPFRGNRGGGYYRGGPRIGVSIGFGNSGYRGYNRGWNGYGGYNRGWNGYRGYNRALYGPSYYGGYRSYNYVTPGYTVVPGGYYYHR